MTDPSFSEKDLQKELSARLGAMNVEQQERLTRQQADQLGLPYMNLTIFPIDPDVIELVPKSLAESAGAVLFYKQGRDVRLGALRPASKGTDTIAQMLLERFNHEPQRYVISKRSLDRALKEYRREQTEEEAPRDEVQVSSEALSKYADTIADLKKLGERISSLPPSEILEAIVTGAVAMDASDIHVEPKENEARLRYRIDGVLQDITSFARDGWALLLSRVKVLASLKLNIHETPQDGSFVLRIGDEVYDMRLSILPGGTGENIVIRLLNRKAEALELADLGMKKRDLDTVQDQLRHVNGMIVMTGPTGSGKTTTLASFIRKINTPDIKIITLEDPIEYRIPGVEQTQVDADAGYTFAKGLRSILRQDPDVILVGEMRDPETAETAIHAALTGHLVLTTLHTNSAAGTVPRLVDMGAKPFTLAPALTMVVAQRLVRQVCKTCGEEYKPDGDLRDRIADAMQGVRADVFDPAVLRKKDLTFLRAKGCEECRTTGYTGRLGLFEIFTIEGEMEELVLQGADEQRIQKAALGQGMTTISQDGFLKVIDQVTTIEEVERISEE